MYFQNNQLLQLPERLSEAEVSAVKGYLLKYKNNRFKIESKAPLIGSNQIVDLVHIQSGVSVIKELTNNGSIAKRYFMNDIHQKRVNVDDTSLFILDNKQIDKKFIACIESSDRPIFWSRLNDLSVFGNTVLNAEPYLPSKFELCSALVTENEIGMWYRCQFQLLLVNNRAQIGLIDSGVTEIADLRNIRKFESQFGYECLTLVCKLRNDEISFDLLNQNLFEEGVDIVALKVRSVGNIHDVVIPITCFVMDDNFEEDILLAEDLQND